MTRMICARSVSREANASFQAVVAISATTPNLLERWPRSLAAALTVTSFLRVSILVQNAWAAGGAQIFHLSYIGVTLIRKQLLRTHVLGREDEGRVASPTEPS